MNDAVESDDFEIVNVVPDGIVFETPKNVVIRRCVASIAITGVVNVVVPSDHVAVAPYEGSTHAVESTGMEKFPVVTETVAVDVDTPA